MEYRILGPLQVIDDGEPIDIGSPQQRSLLALLVLNANRVVSTERILEELWRDDPAGKERTLWVYISRLRAILEPTRRAHAKGKVLVTCDHGYSLVVDECDIDALRFEEEAATANRMLVDDPDGAALLLERALAMWRGAALEDHRYEDFARADAARLDELRLVALEDRIDADLRAGRHRSVVGELGKLVLDHPHRERLVSLQMVALYRSGRQADALRAFERYRELMGEELGIVPSPGICRVQEQVLLHDHELTPPTDPASADEATDVTNPFKGLHAFTEADTEIFFGRDRLVRELVRRVDHGARLAALVGASGSGKSSLLLAGLVPAIRRGTIDGGGVWSVVQMVPSTRPFDELEAALAGAAPGASDRLTGLLRDPDRGMVRACHSVLTGQRDRLFLVIDQFEELFTLGSSPAERDRFIHDLEVMIDDSLGRVVVVIGLRADFYGRPLDYPRLAGLIGEGIVNVVPMLPDELEAAAEQPAERVGVSFEPALVVQLLGDVAGQIGGLPLFQYVLTELFDRRTTNVLTLTSYHEMGGVSGALARRAEDLFLGLDADQRHAARQLFLRLVTIVDQGGWGRRRVTGSEMVTIAADLVATQSVLDQFAARRLLTFDRDPASGSPTVEVAHEALLSEWPRLRRWIDEGRRDVVRHAQLATALAEWTASGQKADYLLTGERLSDYVAWAAISTLELSGEEGQFLDASIMHRDEQLLAEERRYAREMKRDRQARTRLWGLGVGALLIAATAVSGVFLLSDGGDPAIALVHGAVPDQGINDLMISGVGIAEGAHGIDIELEPPLIKPEDHLRRLAESGTDLIVVGSDFDLEADRLALEYPDVHWLAIDPVVVHNTAANLSEVHFAVEEGAYLAGAAAALHSRSGRVGFVGGTQTFRTEAARSGFESGARGEDSDVEVVSTFLGPVADAMVNAERSDELAFELATELYDSGVDVIYHDAGEAGAGVIGAAAAWSEVHEPVWTIGSDADEYYTVPAEERHLVLTSTVKRFDVAVDEAVGAFIDGDLAAGETVLDLDAGGVELSRAGGHLGAPVDARLQELESEIRFGHLVVSPHASRPPAWQLEPDVVVRLRLTDESCEVAGSIAGATLSGERLLVERGQSVVIELTNDSTGVGGVAIREIPVGTSVADLEREALSGIPRSFGPMAAISSVGLGASTSSAVLITDSPVVPNCILRPFGAGGGDLFPLMIVSPT